ncbi:hypothetical protein LMG7143_01108 [Ralstonia thomasii]|nr:hypothetical protein LMG7143_01108 [Ralstonia sp. LMG 18095]
MSWSCFSLPARIWIRGRLARVLLVAALVFGPSLGFSQTSVGADGHLWNAPSYGNHVANDPLSACAAGLAAYNAATGSNLGPATSMYGPISGDPNHYVCSTSSGSGLIDVYRMTGPTSCVPGYTYQADGSCKSNQPSCPAAGQSAPGGNSATGTSPTQTILNPQVCVGGCTYNYSSYWTGATPGQNGGYAAQYTGLSSTGSACSGTGTPSAAQPSPTDPPKQCGARQYSGTVNGANVCIDYPIQTTGGNTSTTTTDAPASSPAASSSSSSQTSTTCDGTTCTTTTIVVGGGGGGVGGSGGGGSGSGASGVGASPCSSTQVSTGAQVNGGPGTCTSTTTQPQDQYCQQNPNAAQCKKGSASGGGTCDAPPTCDGDAISCAILQQQWSTRCDLQKHDDSTDLGSKLANGQDPMAGKLPTPDGADKVDLSSKLSNVDDMGIVAQCLGNIDVPLQLPGGGWNLHIDTTPLCDIGKLLGYLNMLSTMMLCAYMLKGSF